MHARTPRCTWRVNPPDEVPDVHTHALTPGFGHALTAPLVAEVFHTLRVSAAVHNAQAGTWFPIHHEPDLYPFELAHGRVPERMRYNERSFKAVARHHRTIQGEHTGYSDLFVPIVAGGSLIATLVSGPFALARPTSAEVLDRWRSLTGRQGHPGDPEFASYLATSLGILVLDPPKLRAFERVLSCLCELMAGRGDAAALVNETETLRVELARVRSVERAWEATREMVDERFSQAWVHASSNMDYDRLGLRRVPDHVLAGLTVGRPAEPDPVDEAIRRDQLQRYAVELGRSIGDVVAGKIGDHGVVFLSAGGGTPARKRAKLRDLAERMSAVARRRFGFRIHFGAAATSGSEPVWRSYGSALAAAESALVQGAHIVMAEAGSNRSPQSLRHLRAVLAERVQERPAEIGTHFERYLEAVAVQAGHRVDTARAHLDAAFERMAAPLVANGTLDPKSLSVLYEQLDRAAGVARTMGDLFVAYREAARDMSSAAGPVQARRDRNLDRALDYMRRNYATRLRIARVAREAGFSPSHFSKLFIEREGVPFDACLLRLRLERAEQLLATTGLRLGRVAELSGFGTPQYLCRVFRREKRMTPLAYRKSQPEPRSARERKLKSQHE